MTENTPSPLGNVISIDDERIKNHLDRVVRGTVEETLNALLDAEADRLCNAQRYERSEARRDTRAGHYERNLQTKAGEVRLKVPKLRQQTFETAIIERYRRRESSVEEALIEMYLAGVSVRRVEDITEALWGTRVSPSTVSDLNKKIYGTIEAWRNRPIEGEHPYVYLDGIVLKRSWAGEVRNVSLLVAIGVNDRGLSGDSRHLRGRQGGQGGLERVPQAPQGARPERRPADHLGCLPGACRERGRVLPRGGLAALHRALVPQHLQPRALDQGAGDRGHAQGDPRQRGHCGGARKGHPSDREAARLAADQGRRARGSGGRGDADLLRLPGGALAAHPHQQSARAHPARDQAAHARRRRIPGWAIGAQPRRGQAAAHRRHRVVDQEILEHRAAEGPADERCHHRLSQCRAPLSPNQMCEKFWTLPHIRDLRCGISAEKLGSSPAV